MERDELFERYPPLGAMVPGTIPSYTAAGPGGHSVQVHLVGRQLPSFHELYGLLQKVQAHPPSGSFQLLELPEELAVVTEPIPDGMSLEEWAGDVGGVARPQTASDAPVSSASSGDGYTQFFQAPQPPPVQKSIQEPAVTPPPPPAPPAAAPSTPGEEPSPVPPTTPAAPPEAGSDYSAFFRAPSSPEETAGPKPPAPPPPPTPKEEPEYAPEGSSDESESGGYTEFFQAPKTGDPVAKPTIPKRPQAPPAPIQPMAPPPPAPPSPPTQPAIPMAPVPPPAPPPPPPPPAFHSAQEPDPDSITAEFRKPMAPPPPQQEAGKGRDWASSAKGSQPQALPMGDYLARLDSSMGGTPANQPLPPPVAPAAPAWAMEGGAPSAPPSRPETNAPPASPGAGAAPDKRFRKRDMVIFGAVVGFVLIAAVVTVLVVLLTGS